ncbi:DUF3152 domain-containing protein [Streptomyces sp. t39]|uniref:DUF3152 domain-containing protein n=1 Tax=Streptomyces sp. t39 TaxID=1828156 RepID=UPI0011CD41F3|nr:DUF3152 domain-containing protein [Streptomyces sp. t39]TXS56790.1 DUF3152 domain-containing protein [Streptomyces sp. t39]
MGRHSRKGPVPKGTGTPGAPGTLPGAREAAAPGGGRRRRPGEQHAPAPGPGAPVRGGHPEHHESGGGWGDWQTGAMPQVRSAPAPAAPGPRIPGPRREFVEAFDGPVPPGEPREPERGGPGPDGGDHEDGGVPPAARGGRGRAFTGVAAAAVTTVLAVIVAGQVTEERPDGVGSQSASQERGAVQERPDRSEGRATPQQESEAAPAAPAPTYEQLMAAQFPIDPRLKGSGEFEAVPGFDKGPGKGRRVRYRIDVEKGLGLDAGLFARAVQETLNDDRSWAHNGAMTFERVSSGEAEFVLTLASPGTTGVWCAKSGLDTTVDNVSCDSASTERVMINAYRWARGAETYGPKAMHAYRQMLINHEVGHRLGHNHVNCATPGALAPVMQQQTKSLDVGGVACRANPWVHPGG